MAKRFDRRDFLTGGLAAGAAAAGLGMGMDLASAGIAGAQTNGSGRNGVSHAKPKRGGKLTFGVDAEEQGFDPTSARFDEVGVMYARTVFDPLTIITPSGAVAPYLAQSVVPNADYTQWTVTLRPNLVFHDGSPCDGAALLTNFEAQSKSLLTGIVLSPVLENFVQSGPLSVQVNLKSPWIPFPYYLAGHIGGQLGYVVAPSMLKASNGTTHPIGTGPFKFDVWDPNDHFTATRNPNYWRHGLPYLDQITFRPIIDANSRAEALRSGSIDIMITDTPQVIVQFRGNRQYSYIDDSGPVVGEPDMNCLLLNTAKPPFDDYNLRLAAAKSISPAQYSKVIDIGVNAPSYGVFVPGTPYHTATGYPKYDPAGAARLVAQAKHQGKPVSFTLGSTGSPTSVRAATYMQQKLQAAGFQVSTAIFQQNELINNALSGTFQAFEWRQFGAVNPDMNYIFWSSTTVSDNNLSINMARNADPQIEAALQTGRSSTSASARIKAYQMVNKRFAKDLPYIWNDRAVWAVVAKPSVQNFNNPTTPSGARALGMSAGSIWPTQIWKT